MYIDQINWKGEEYDIYSKEVENASTGVVDFDSEDSLNPSKFDDSVDLVESGETLSELCEKFSTTVKNVRYLGNLTGDTDISNIDSGTLTGAIKLLNETLYDSDGNIRLGTDDVGSEIQFIYLDKGKPTATTVATVGTSTKPIYINNGKFTESNATRGAWNRIMYMSSGSLVESDGAVGEDEKSLIYMKDGYFYKSGESVGSDGKTLMYIEDGTFKESAVSVGENGKTLMYLNNGTLTASKEDVGNFAQPIYLKNGELTAFDTDLSMGSYNNPVYINNGYFTAFNQTIGDAKTPVYLKSGVITECSYSIGDLSNYLPLSGGTLTGKLTINSTLAVNTSNGVGIELTQEKEDTAGEIRVTQTWPSTKRSISLHCGQGGSNRGLFDDGLSSWIIYHDSSDNTCIPNATTISANTQPLLALKSTTKTGEIRVTNNYGEIALVTNTNTNRGLYDRTGDSSRWLIYYDSDNHIHLPNSTYFGTHIYLPYDGHLYALEYGSSPAYRTVFYMNEGTNPNNDNKVSCYSFAAGSNANIIEIGSLHANEDHDYTKAIYFYGIYKETTSATVNLHIGSGGRVMRYSSSSQRYKDIIKEIVNNDIQKLYDIPVYFFKYKEGYLNKTDIRYNTEIPGFIAEDWDAIMPIAVDYNEDGQPEMWNSNIVVPLMFEMIKNNHTLITELQEQIAQLTN